MDRRSFLRGLLGSAVISTPAVKYILPPIGGWGFPKRQYRTGMVGDVAHFEFREGKANIQLGQGKLFFGDGRSIPVEKVSYTVDHRKLLTPYGDVVREHNQWLVHGKIKVHEDNIRKLIELSSCVDIPVRS